VGTKLHRRAFACMGIAGTLVLGACTPPPSGSTPTTTAPYTGEPVPPVVQSFTVKSSISPAPSLVTLTWNVTDANLDSLTCEIDGNGDGVFEIAVTNCNVASSRNVSIPNPGTVTAALRVSDGTFPAVTATRAFTVPSGSTESFDITMRGLETLSPQVAAAFQAAKTRWESIIARGTPDVSIGARPSCLPSDVPDLPSVIDDIVVDVSTPAIDGPGKILGQAGPTCVLMSNELGVHGIMQFDSADVSILLGDGTLTDVVAHELGHVLGFGTLWDMSWAPGGVRNVLSGAGSSDPRFTGVRAVAEYALMGRAGNVPVENSGGPGTRDSHWRESTFANELMTGYINLPTNPLSRMSIASMADLSYRVNIAAADSYQLPGGALARLMQPSAEDYGEILRPPVDTL
jgi:hypothetical protein